MFRIDAAHRKADQMSQAPALLETLLPSILAFCTVALVGVEALVTGSVIVICWLGLLVGWTIAVAVVMLVRRRRLKPLAEARVRAARRVTPSIFGVPEDQAGAETAIDPGLRQELLAALRSRRLVLVCGERSSAKVRIAYDAIRTDLGGYALLRPRLYTDAQGPPLGALLKSGAMSRKRCILWIPDIAPFLAAGLDPRVIERWLGAAHDRLALATITPSALRRFQAMDSSESVALDRALLIEVPNVGAPNRVARRFWMSGSQPEETSLLTVAALWALLDVVKPLDERLAKTIASSICRRWVTSHDLDRACRGEGAGIRIRDGTVEADPQLITLFDQDEGRLDPNVVGAILGQLESDPVSLLAVGQSLTVRGQLEYAERALRRAQRIAPADLRPAITTALVNLVELHDASGTRLSRPGGLDYAEPMGAIQRRSLPRTLPSESDGTFDPSSPEQAFGWDTRLFRLRLHRAAIRSAVLLVLDMLALAIASDAALAVRAMAQGHPPSLIEDNLGKMVISELPVALVIFTVVGLYRTGASHAARLAPVMAAVTGITAIVATGFLVVGVDLGSAFALLVLAGVAICVDWIFRAVYDSTSRSWVRRHQLQPRVLIAGPPENARVVARGLSAGERPVQCVAFISPPSVFGSSDTGDHDPFEIASYLDLDRVLTALHIDELLIADPALDAKGKADLISWAHRAGVDARFQPSPDEVILGVVGRVAEDGLASVPAALLSPEALELKRLLDLAIVTITLPAWGLAMALCALHSVLRRRGQPVLVSTERIGLGGVAFSMLRLRTRTIRSDGSRAARATGRIEALMERSGLDELPQMVNVLRGDMSVVGPRPITEPEFRRFSRDERRTLTVRPGMTGVWQVHRPPDASESAMRSVETNYLRHWRLSHDLAVMVRTLVTVMTRGYLGETAIQNYRRFGKDLLLPSRPASERDLSRGPLARGRRVRQWMSKPWSTAFRVVAAGMRKLWNFS